MATTKHFEELVASVVKAIAPSILPIWMIKQVQ
jgi:hypothetical protein